MSLNIRLEKIRKYSGKNPTAFGSQFESIGAENFRKLLKKHDANPSYKFIAELLKLYPEINYRWLLFGDGEMFVQKNKNNMIEDVSENYNIKSYSCPDCISKQKEIDALNIALEAKEELLEFYRGKKESKSQASV